MPGKTVRQNIISQAGRIVVKVGTSAITDQTGRLDRRCDRDVDRLVSGCRGGWRGVVTTSEHEQARCQRYHHQRNPERDRHQIWR